MEVADGSTFGTGVASSMGWKGVRVGVESRPAVTKNRVVGVAAGNAFGFPPPAAAQPVTKTNITSRQARPIFRKRIMVAVNSRITYSV